MSEVCFVCHKSLDGERIIGISNAHAHFVICAPCHNKMKTEDFVPILDSLVQSKDATIARLTAERDRLAEATKDIAQYSFDINARRKAQAALAAIEGEAKTKEEVQGE